MLTFDSPISQSLVVGPDVGEHQETQFRMFSSAEGDGL